MLNTQDLSVEDFVSQYRLGSIWGGLGSEARAMTVPQAIQESNAARKLLSDGWFAK